MEFVFARRWAIPLWAIAWLTVVVTAPPPATLFLMPPTALFVIAVLGITAIIFAMPGVIPWVRTARSVVRAVPCGDGHKTSVAMTMAAGISVRTLDEPDETAAADALDLVRMDDDGGWQMARPPA